MSRKLILALTLISFAFCGASFAAVENIKVSGDITVTGVLRDLTLGTHSYFDLGIPPAGGYIGATAGEQDSFFLSQVRVRFDADLTENVSAVVRLLNERIWGQEITEDTDVVIDLAYIELREFLYQPLTLVVGRQNLRYGNGMIIGDPDTNMMSSGTNAMLGPLSRDLYGDLSMRKSFDAIKGIIDFSPYTIDLFYAKISEGWLNENSADNSDDIDLYGVNVAYDWSSYNGVTEAYFIYNTNSRNAFGVLEPFEIANNQSKTFVAGGRFQFDPSDNLTLGLEGAYQFGDIPLYEAAAAIMFPGFPTAYEHLSAFAAQLIGEYRFLNDYNAKLGANFSYFSGADDWTNGNPFGGSLNNTYNGWNPMFEDQTGAEIMNILFPQTNIMFASISGSMMPREDITVGMTYAWAKLAQNVDSQLVINPATGTPGWYTVPYYGAPFIPAYGMLGMGPAEVFGYRVNRDETFLGQEIDAYVLYDYTEDVQIKLTTACFLPGKFFHDENDEPAYSFKGSMAVNF